jgi:hypothetical protein
VSSVANEVSPNTSTKEFKTHDNNDCDNEHDNLKYDSVHDMNSDCIPPCTAWEEIPLENTGNNFDGGSSVSCELWSGSSFSNLPVTA